MARIDLDLAHAYLPNPRVAEDYALLPMRVTFEDGGAYALLGPSGCGKTTMLNIISGLVTPSQGTVCFDWVDRTDASPQQRNIAQVFQFPVIYDTMTVGENLAFPLRNRKVPSNQIRERVGRIAEMLDLSHQLEQRAANLSADAKQKISLGRGLVRSDVSAVLFDEPLTVIDPHLKWELRRKLKQIHSELGLTLIYVTHDQVEAMTFAEQVMVMSRGRIVQQGTPEDLFERPRHTFVGHFIGSPGMNLLPLERRGDALWLDDEQCLALPKAPALPTGALTLGIRPEYLDCLTSDDGRLGTVTAIVSQVRNIGTSLLLSARIGAHELKAHLPVDSVAPEAGQSVRLAVLGPHTCFYRDEELIT